ncbi:hypothetical protein DUNSADRAFT_16943 [Dunaliella salina]|uniref:Encoded protein n=1 Tax=Dunaliella salina TaxID=3046 RepID=A0ABQ7H0L3_DUNSA|nr:hypothetical protein DUNSADRAFT_16943 [Dunaliella salina]|eukprot:KAF5840396.1 hypothetical protein DUNSADRAFT_16943 [Dunaliella salina]
MLKRVLSASDLGEKGVLFPSHNAQCAKPTRLRRISSSNTVSDPSWLDHVKAKTPSRLHLIKPPAASPALSLPPAPKHEAQRGSPAAKPPRPRTPPLHAPFHIPPPSRPSPPLHTPHSPQPSPPSNITPAAPSNPLPSLPVRVFRASHWDFSALRDLLSSCQQLQDMISSGSSTNSDADPQRSIIGTTCRMLSSSLRRISKHTVEALTSAPGAWHLSPHAGITISEFGYAEAWTLNAREADARKCLDLELHHPGSRSTVQCFQRSDVDQPWMPVGVISAACSDIRQQMQSANPVQQLADAYALVTAKPAAAAHACQLALAQGLSLSGLASLLQAAADGLAATPALLHSQFASNQQAHPGLAAPPEHRRHMLST